MNMVGVDLDSDEDSSIAKEEDFLWRLHPSESLSDWTIAIVDEGRKRTEVYYVHKSIVSAGARRCEYFIPIMRGGGRFAENAMQQSTVHLQSPAADAFPAMLDFVYGGALKCSTENATALHHLGGYFGAKRLRHQVRQFLKHDICAVNSGVYFTQATLFRDTKVYSALVEACASELLEIDTGSSIVQVGSAEFWIHVADSGTRRSDFRRHLSMLIASFCKLHPNIDLETFISLTSKENISDLMPSAALSFCQHRHFSAVVETGQTDLPHRCIKCVAESWDEVGWDDVELQKALNQMDKSLVIELTLEISRKSQERIVALTEDLEDSNRERDRMKRERKSLQKSLKSMKKEADSLTKCNQMLNTKLERARLRREDSNLGIRSFPDNSSPCVSLDCLENLPDDGRKRRPSLSSQSLGSTRTWAHESRIVRRSTRGGTEYCPDDTFLPGTPRTIL